MLRYFRCWAALLVVKWDVMNDPTTKSEDFLSLYHRAFEEYGAQALWNMRPLSDPTPPTPWQSRRRCERMAEWKGGDWRNRSRESALPLTKLQSHVLRVTPAMETGIATRIRRWAICLRLSG
jgi:hypothetical protein